MSGKIQPVIKQQYFVTNVPDEKGNYSVKCKHCSS